MLDIFVRSFASVDFVPPLLTLGLLLRLHHYRQKLIKRNGYCRYKNATYISTYAMRTTNAIVPLLHAMALVTQVLATSH